MARVLKMGGPTLSPPPLVVTAPACLRLTGLREALKTTPVTGFTNISGNQRLHANNNCRRAHQRRALHHTPSALPLHAPACLRPTGLREALMTTAATGFTNISGNQTLQAKNNCRRAHQRRALHHPPSALPLHVTREKNCERGNTYNDILYNSRGVNICFCLFF
ncbi:hypothetical protein HPB47_024967 [Ixodes persulcatus]|uniref:Uncharacterized protein n=1 Tax=Ixodes persulcatus TaxID=34615 RepID=A0AC60Q2U6_IXOPE|nr:hypothetical protein HPB47_024967 [Ixodes persulcatus]